MSVGPGHVGEAEGSAPAELLLQLMEGVRDVVCLFDVETEDCRCVNSFVEELLGISAAEFRREGLGGMLERVHPDDREAVRTAYECAAFASRDEHRSLVHFRYRRADGRFAWLCARWTPVGEGQGEAEKVVCTAWEFTDHMQSVQNLSEERQFLNAVFDTAPALILVLDPEGRIVRFNQACEKLTGYSAEELEGESGADILIPPDEQEEVAKVFQSVKQQDGVLVHENHWMTREGEECLISWADKRVTGRDGEVLYVVCTGQDVTEQREMEQQLRRSARLKSVGQLAGGIAHDFNNILTAIIGYAELNLAELGEEECGLRDDLLEIKQAATRGGELVEQLLAFSSQQEVQSCVMELNDAVRNVNSMLSQVIEEDIQLKLDLSEEDLHVEMAPAQLEQVLVNLAVNARDAMPNGGVLTVRTRRVRLGTDFARTRPGTMKGPYAMIAVSDTGVGMPEEVRERVFDPFFTTKENGDGTGLGLSSVYGVVEQHGGRIECLSQPGSGSTFKIYLPLVLEGEPEEVEEGELAERFAGDENILLAEDEQGVRQMAVRSLRSFGYNILAAEDGSGALEKLEEFGEEPDLLIADVVMPGMSGPELAQKVRLSYPRTKLLFISGYADQQGPKGRQARSVTPLLRKPFTTSRLAQSVRSVLDHP